LPETDDEFPEESAPSPAPLALALEDQASAYVQAAKAPATLRAYHTDWAHFRAWCEAHSRDALPATPVTVALYLADHASRHKPAPSTVAWLRSRRFTPRPDFPPLPRSSTPRCPRP
jgi:hypothetical protein